MAISQETVEEVLRVANVYDVISEYIPLEKAGSSYKALCPFHTEKTPSFMVSPQKNIFKCFGCGKSGSAITFLMEYEGISFGEAVIKLAEKYNIPVKFTKEDKSFQEKNRLFQVTQKITEFYQEQLKKSSEAKNYLKKRGLLPSTIETFEIGFSPFESNALKQFIQKENISVDELQRIGLITIKESGDFVDKFAGRVIFPIKNHRGRVVAFGGRAISDNKSPKYINSPETEIYSKGKVLYGLYNAKDSLREKKEAIIVEGYLDLISLYQVGIKNVVATLGTAMTSEHGKLLSKFINRAVLMFDSDSAGKKAAIRAAKVLLPYRIEVYYCPIEKGKDPDELAKEGSQAVLNQLQKSQDFLLFLLDRLQAQKDLKKRKEIIDLYLDILSYMPDKHIQGVYLKELSTVAGIPVELLEVQEREFEVEKEEISSFKGLPLNEKLILKGLLLYKDQILNEFDQFDKISGSAYFMYLINELLKGGELEELEEIKNFEIPVSPEDTIEALNLLHRNWLKQQTEIDATFLSNLDDSILQKILETKKSLYTGGRKQK
ncbi:DNA primase [Persephonella sp.]|uniref:DNA primase n=1 Tax=Persephonella sp. TaxID=2060922 RepID=UPI002604DDCE|nr:DNA primase [Persephonella sp.]